MSARFPVSDRIPSSRSSTGFTLIELLIVMTIVAILVSLALAVHSHARARGIEAAALSALTAINQAQFAYMQTCGKQRYAPTLVSLGVVPPGYSAAFLSPDLTASDPLLKSEYVIAMRGTPASEGELTCTNEAPLTSYMLTADPLRPESGAKFFGSNTDRAIYADAVTFREDMPDTGAPEHGTEVK
jgi:prepilin-type N-terminal cleavage/methylation domain-containing protein